MVKLTVAAFVALAAQGCASPGTTDPARASRNAAGQAALDGMENAVLKDNDPDTPSREKSMK